MNLEDILNNEKAQKNFRKGRKTKRKVSPDEHKDYIRGKLEESFLSWYDMEKPKDLDELYESAQLVTRNLTVYADDIPFLHDKIVSNGEAGVFISALINQTEEDSVITLVTGNDPAGNLGMFLEKRTVIIEGTPKFSDYENLGYKMKSGKLIIKGSSGEDYGNKMEGGELIIEGKTNGKGLHGIKGGHAIINEISNVSHFSNWGRNLYDEGFGAYQKGGLIEILCDVPNYVENIGYGQKAGELKVIGKVDCGISSHQEGGETTIKGNIGTGYQQSIGDSKKGGVTNINGDVHNGLIGWKQKGGLTKINGNVKGTVGHESYENAEIDIIGNVNGKIGYDVYGTKITIKGDVQGDVGGFTMDFICKIDGNVKGKVGECFGCYNHIENRKREGLIKITGNVDGDVAESMHLKSKIIVKGNVNGTVGEFMYGGEVRVGGYIQKMGNMIGGIVYQNGRDVTHVPFKHKILNLIAAVLPGEKIR